MPYVFDYRRSVHNHEFGDDQFWRFSIVYSCKMRVGTTQPPFKDNRVNWECYSRVNWECYSRVNWERYSRVAGVAACYSRVNWECYSRVAGVAACCSRVNWECYSRVAGVAAWSAVQEQAVTTAKMMTIFGPLLTSACVCRLGPAFDKSEYGFAAGLLIQSIFGHRPRTSPPTREPPSGPGPE
eukprot:359846-Chlamydomonas_euryale.AAC.3